MRQLVALAEVRTALFLREGVVDVEPRYLGPDHEVEVGFAPGVRVESAEAEPQNLRSRVITLEDRRTAAASEEPAHARAGLPALKKVLSAEKDEIGSPDSGRGTEAGSRMFAATPAVAQGDGADEISADLVAHASACARSCEHRVLFTPPDAWR